MRHTDRSYDTELENLRERLLLMGERVDVMISDALSAFAESDTRRAGEVSARDGEINALELEIDQKCLSILARRQPVASDLRFLTSVLKTVTDLERVGDLAANLADRVVELAEDEAPARASVVAMGTEAVQLFRRSLTALAQQDSQLAHEVMAGDEGVDSMYARIFPELLHAMTSRPELLLSAQRVQSIAKYLERIADHATNLAEMVVFMVHGEDPRHPGLRARDS